MHLYLQWALATPRDWERVEIDSLDDWLALPRKPQPVGGEVIDDEPGWYAGLMVQGVDFADRDYVHVAPTDEGGLVVTAWRDDPRDNQPGLWLAEQWQFRPLAPDPAFGGALNTRQSRILWLGEYFVDHWQQQPPNQEVRRYEEFTPPPLAEAVAGIWLPGDAWLAHVAARTEHPWQEWGE